MMHQLGNIRQNAEVGGKARSLDAMIRADFHVPNGIVLDAESWRNDAWKKELPVMDGLFAVRSSSSMEDAAYASRAGMFLTKTRVSSSDLINAVEEVVAQARAIASDQSFAVIVQEWINGETSGVSFSRHPLKAYGQTVVIDAVAGSAESVVAGTTKPSRAFAWEKSALVPEDFLINHSMVQRIERETRHAEQTFQTPVDVEWTVASGELWILQARPITRLPNESDVDKEEARIMWRFSSRHDLCLDRALFADSIPHASYAALAIVRSLFAPDGAFDCASLELAMKFDVDAADEYVELLFDALYVDESRQPVKMPNGFFQKLKTMNSLQRATRNFPIEFYTRTDADPFLLYAKTTLLMKIALAQPRAYPIDIKAIWNAREKWLAEKQSTVAAQDFDLQHPEETRQRAAWKRPENIHDLYAIIREDAKDEIRVLLPREKVSLAEPAPYPLPEKIVWQDLFDLENAGARNANAEHGIGVSPGMAQGKIMIPKLPNDHIEPRAIVVVHSLTPDWFTLFDQGVAGIITETGGLMSHGAIQCRERGIPAVFGFTQAKKKFLAGEMVAMDGKNGRVWKE